MWRQKWLGNLCKVKPSRRNTDPRVYHRFSRRFLRQNYPKYISDILSKILEKKEQIFCLNLWSSWNRVSCGGSWKSLLPIFLIFYRNDFGGFVVCWLFNSIQQLNGVEKNSLADTLILNHNLTGLKVQHPGEAKQSFLNLLRQTGHRVTKVYKDDDFKIKSFRLSYLSTTSAG